MKNQQNMQQQTQKKGWHGYKMRQKGIKHSSNQHMGQMFSQLKLTDEQQFQISILRDEMKLEMKKLRGAKQQGKMAKFIGDNGFDKEAFTKEANTMKTKKIVLKADHMEKVFKILTKEQIAELKKNLNS
jgi:Spy/CpxP family protein refolding chaperone